MIGFISFICLICGLLKLRSHLFLFLFVFKMLEDQMPDLDNELVQKVCGVIDVNAFEIRIPMAIIRAHSPNPFINSHDSLKGAFYEAALMNHSCVPNAQIAIGTDQVNLIQFK